MAQLVGALSHNRKTAGLVPLRHIPSSRGSIPCRTVYSPRSDVVWAHTIPILGADGRQPTNVSLSHGVSFSPFLSLCKSNEKMFSGKDEKKERKVRMFQWIREFFSSLSYYFKILILYFINLFCSLNGKKFWLTFMLFLYMFLFFFILMRKYMCSHRKGMKWPWAADELVTADWFISISLVIILSTIIICVEDCGG